jgi:hypothetical protein
MEPGAISLNDFAFNRYIADGGYWRHLKSWWQVRQHDDVLFLCYELMQKDIDATIVRVAEFIGIALDDDLQALTREHTSIGFMKQHQDRFDDAMMRRLSEDKAGLPPGSDSTKVRSGKVGDHQKNLTPEILAALDEAWEKEIKPLTGCENYAELISKLESEAA